MPAPRRTSPRIPPTTRTAAIAIALVLLAIDVALICADLLRHRGLLHDVRFAVTVERSYGEWFQYLKSATIAVLLLKSGVRIPAAFAWAGLFGYLLVDDAFAVHEAFGRLAASHLGLPGVGAIRPEQVGELFVYAAIGSAFVWALAAVTRRGDAASRSLTLTLLLPFSVLVFFGAVVDTLHSLLSNRAYRYAAGVVEDGGEMLAMSVLVAIVYWATRPERQLTSSSVEIH
jgi:hypothetical protein